MYFGEENAVIFYSLSVYVAAWVHGMCTSVAVHESTDEKWGHRPDGADTDEHCSYTYYKSVVWEEELCVYNN